MRTNAEAASVESILRNRDGFTLSDVRRVLDQYENGRLDLEAFPNSALEYASLFSRFSVLD